MINGGFTIDGLPALDLHIMMTRDSERPIAPSTVDRFMSIPGRNGILDFGADTGARYFNLVCDVITSDHIALQEAAERIATVLLDGYGKPRTFKLVFDTRPDRYYLVRYSGSLGIERLYGYGRFTLPLVTVGEPVAYALSNVFDQDGLLYDIGLEYNEGLIYPNPTKFEWEYIEQHSSIHNYSHYHTSITITIVGSVENGSIEHVQSGKRLTLPNTDSQTMIIDTQKLTIKVDGSNGLRHSNGEFFNLLSGDNQIIFRADSATATVSYEWLHKFY